MKIGTSFSAWQEIKSSVPQGYLLGPFMFLGQKDNIKLCIDVNGIVVQMTDSAKILGVTMDSMLSFNHHV